MDCDGKRQRRFSCKHGTREEGGKAGVEQEITEGTEMEGQQMWMPDSGNAISILFLRYLRFLLFNPKPINQQKETEKGKQKTEIEGGKCASQIFPKPPPWVIGARTFLSAPGDQSTPKRTGMSARAQDRILREQYLTKV